VVSADDPAAVTKMPWSDSYQPNNTITGTLCLDTVTIAGFELVNHPFGVATQVDIFPSEWRLRKLTPVTKTPGFLSGPADGVMGLGFSVCPCLSNQVGWLTSL
jgi:hypothetical protein